ncbi:hypothetical protein SLS60_012097 [Paraconiothyrium brasiliense]|uniref:Uncharacterized protein n=1 Tax=Paraconiothyrium brasiliense TaxID=300254 RepID=A0ABR3QHE5_9PLEO
MITRLLDANIFFPGSKDGNGNRLKAAVDADVITARLMQGRDDLGDVTEYTVNHICDLSYESEKKAIALGNLYGILAPKPKGIADTEVVFNNLAALTPTSQSLTSAQPDYYIGVGVLNINKELRKDLENYIQPAQNLSLPLAPNLFLEVKGIGSSD